MEDLIRRIVEAREGSRELDAEIFASLGTHVLERRGDDRKEWWYPINGSGRRVDPNPNNPYPGSIPRFTTNLQDALGLVPEGYDWALEWDGTAEALYWERGVATAKVGDPMLRLDSEAATPALALTAAALKAIQEMER